MRHCTGEDGPSLATVVLCRAKNPFLSGEAARDDRSRSAFANSSLKRRSRSPQGPSKKYADDKGRPQPGANGTNGHDCWCLPPAQGPALMVVSGWRGREEDTGPLHAPPFLYNCNHIDIGTHSHNFLYHQQRTPL